MGEPKIQKKLAQQDVDLLVEVFRKLAQWRKEQKPVVKIVKNV